MKRHFAGLFTAWIVSTLVTVGMGMLTVWWWFFLRPALWFLALFAGMTLLPFFLSGYWFSDGHCLGRRGRCLLLIEALAPVLLFCLPLDQGLRMLGLIGVMLGDLMARETFWETVLYGIINLSALILYHLGWNLRKPDRKEYLV